jgi:hypothetical protein
VVQEARTASDWYWNKEWLNSDENKALLKEISEIKAARSKERPPEGTTTYTFAAPVTVQTIELTKRTFIQQWRDPSYIYGKLFTAVIVGIFSGFTFYKLGDSIASLQSRLFTAFLILLIPATVVNAVVPKLYQNRALWEAREYPSRIYGWFAFCTAQIVTEIPSAVVSAVLYWLLWYYPTGLPSDSSTAGYVFLMTLLFFLFMNSWGRWICAFAPSFTVISNVNVLVTVKYTPNLSQLTSSSGPTILLRYGLTFQRNSAPVRLHPRILAVLDVLCQILRLTGSTASLRQFSQNSLSAVRRRSRALQSAAGADMRTICRQFCEERWSRLPDKPLCND